MPRWTTRSPITSRPTASHSGCSSARGRAEWFLNYRGGSFLLPADAATARDAALAGVTTEPLDDATLVQIRGEIQGGNMDAVPLEKAPKVAVYAPPNAAPWDDAVTMALNYAGIKFEKIWDPEVMGQGLKTYDWLHLHHEDFTGQYSKFFLNYAGAPWLVGDGGAEPDDGPHARLPVGAGGEARRGDGHRQYVERGGFLFAMCTATETLDLALAADGVDIAAAYADGTPMDPDATSRMHWDRALAFQDAHLELSPTMPVYSDIDGHQVTRRSGGSRSARSRSSTSAPRSIRSPRCWCRTTDR